MSQDREISKTHYDENYFFLLIAGECSLEWEVGYYSMAKIVLHIDSHANSKIYSLNE